MQVQKGGRRCGYAAQGGFSQAKSPLSKRLKALARRPLAPPKGRRKRQALTAKAVRACLLYSVCYYLCNFLLALRNGVIII